MASAWYSLAVQRFFATAGARCSRKALPRAMPLKLLARVLMKARRLAPPSSRVLAASSPPLRLSLLTTSTPLRSRARLIMATGTWRCRYSVATADGGEPEVMMTPEIL